MGSNVRVTPRGQLTIPVDMRRRHGIEPGSRVELREEGDRLYVESPVAAETGSEEETLSELRESGETRNWPWETRLGSSMMTTKGQITVPAEVRERHGFKPGERVVFRELNGRVIVEPATASVDRLHGMLAHLAIGRTPATIEEMEEAAAAGWAREPIEPR